MSRKTGSAAAVRGKSRGAKFCGPGAAGTGRRADPAMGRCPPDRDRRNGPTGVPGRSAGWTTRPGRRSTQALRRGRRGLPGGSSLARLLAEERGVTEGANPEAPAERLRAWEAEQFADARPRLKRGLAATAGDDPPDTSS